MFLGTNWVGYEYRLKVINMYSTYRNYSVCALFHCSHLKLFQTEDSHLVSVCPCLHMMDTDIDTVDIFLVLKNIFEWALIGVPMRASQPPRRLEGCCEVPSG